MIAIPHLAPLLLQIPGSRPLSMPNPGSRKTYWGPSIYFSKIPIQKLVYFVSIPVTFRFFIRLGFPLMCDFLSVECHFLIFRQQLTIYIVRNWLGSNDLPNASCLEKFCFKLFCEWYRFICIHRGPLNATGGNEVWTKQSEKMVKY